MYRMAYLTLGQERWTTGEVLVGYQAHLGAYLYVYHGVCIQYPHVFKSVRRGSLELRCSEVSVVLLTGV